MRAWRPLYCLTGIGLVFAMLGFPAVALARLEGEKSLLSGTMITVNTIQDDVLPNGNCTIREALMAAENDSAQDGCPAGNGVDTVVIPTGNYLITGGSFTVSSPVILIGAGRDQTILDAEKRYRVIKIDPYPVTIQGLTIQHGTLDNYMSYEEADGGAGLLNHGTLILKNVKFAWNYSEMYSSGAIKNSGDLTVENSLFFHNSSYGSGAAIENFGTARVYQTVFLENRPYEWGTVSNSADATLEIDESEFIDNSNSWDASAIYGYGKITVRNTLIDCSDEVMEQNGAVWIRGGETLLENVTIQNCLTIGLGGSVLQDGGTLKIVRSTIKNGVAGNQGGGIALRAGSLEVRESLISGNIIQVSGIERGGAAIYVSGGSGLVINSTIIENSTEANGAVFVTGGVLELRSVTLARNTGGGLVVAGGTARVHNSILAENGPDCSGGLGGIVSLGYNLVGNAAGCGWVEASMDDIGTASQPIDPKLGALEDNGGLTWTVELLPSSPAIDDGDNANCPATDQRGVPRPIDGNQDGNASCDKGAYEVNPLVFLPMISR